MTLAAVAAAIAPLFGVPALALLWLRPALAFARRDAPLQPPDRFRGLALRPVRYARSWTRSVAGRARRSPAGPAEPDLAALRDDYAAAVADGIGRFFEPRRDDCPWCGSTALTRQARVGDLLQGKPGTFTLERCRDCGHVFQNPRLSPAGLDYYYRDFYDGVNGAAANAVLGTAHRSYGERAEMIRPHGTPKAWLDVGGASGQFCGTARDVWPGTRFDVLDMSDAVHEAVRLGRAGTGHLGQFPDLAATLAGRYDVVSMFHYLEHTRDPRAELAAAATVLAPGGHLLIEVPDPRSPQRHLFRSWWLCWFQPQHQHFVPAGNLRAALAERGFTVVGEETGTVHSGGEFFAVVAFALMKLAPSPARPWAPRPPTRGRRLRHRVTAAALLPLFAGALLLELTGSALLRRTGTGDAYRMIARRNEDRPCT